MVKDNDKILEPINKDCQVPEDYFQNIEDRVLGTYHKRQRIRRRKVLLSVSCVLVLAIVGVFFARYDSTLLRTDTMEQLASLTPTTTPPNEMIMSEEIAKVEVNKTEKEKTITNTPVKQKAVANYSKKEEVRYTEKELNYLENYLNEDTYELVYNSLVK